MKKSHYVDKFNPEQIPKIQKVLSKNIPQELKDLSRWTCWFWWWDGKKWTKPPCDLYGNKHDGTKASFSFAQAYKAHKKSNGKLGIGFSLQSSDPYCGIDIDGIHGPGRTKIKGLKKLLKEFPGYIEDSPSNKGIRIIGLGKPATVGAKAGSVIEVYSGGRYLTITGRVNGYSGDSVLVDISKAADYLVGWLADRSGMTTPQAPGQKGGLMKIKKPVFLPDVIKVTDYAKQLEGIDPDEGGYDPWKDIGMALWHEYKGSEKGFDIWDKWSARGAAYPGPDTLMKKWESFDHGTYDGPPKTGASITYVFRQLNKDWKGTLESEDPNIVPIQSNRFKKSPQLELSWFPAEIQKAAAEIARFNKVDVGPVLATMLVIASGSINKNARIQERAGHEHNARIACLLGMRSGSRKSAIDKHVFAPVSKFERDKTTAWNEDKFHSEAIITLLKEEVKMVKSELRKDHLTVDQAAADLAELEKKISKAHLPQPVYVVSDVTEEQLAEEMGRNNETMMVLSDEGLNIIENIIGRYSASGGYSIHLHGLTHASTYKKNRTTSENVNLQNPVLNESIKTQPDPLLMLLDDQRFIEYGLAARFYLNIVDDPVGDQYAVDVDEKDLKTNRLSDYNALITKMMGVSFDMTEGSGFGLASVVLGKEARKMWVDYSNKYSAEIKALEEGSGTNENSWWVEITNKKVSKSVIVAGVLCIMENAKEYCSQLLAMKKYRRKGYERGMTRSKIGEGLKEIRKDLVITADQYARACSIVDALTQQTLDVLEHARNESDMKTAWKGFQDLLGALREGKWSTGQFPMSAINRKMSDKQKKRSHDYMELLMSHGYVVQLDNGRHYRLNTGVMV